MSDGKPHEIVIIKRGGHGDHDEHHGGVWKIAFADFMTAMMAFFLVMWLISANDKTRASVARYFNPVRLVDATTQPRGLHDTKKDESGITATPDDAKKADDKQSKPESTSKDVKEGKEEGKEKAGQDKPGPEKAGKETPAAREKRLDAALRENPYVALAEIAATRAPGEGPAPLAPPTPAVGRRGGDTFRDPFAPPPPMASADEDGTEPPDAPAAHAAAKVEAGPKAIVAEGRPADAGRPDGKAAESRRAEARAGDSRAVETKGVEAKGVEAKALEAKGVEAKALEAKAAAAKAEEAKAMLAALQPQGGDAAPEGSRDGPGVDVHRTSEGLLVSFTDTAGFSMFGNGSAVPNRRIVLMMERVGRLMKERPGEVVVRGFTDAKPYRGKPGRGDRYDNWHLSLDRAQVTHYMLVRGGLADARVGHVEGYADRGTRPGIDPSSPLNRRIEVLLKDPA